MRAAPIPATILWLACLAQAACTHAPRAEVAAEAAQVPAPTPRLAVVVVVDQMRADYLTRYRPYFTGGFQRLLSEGRDFPDAWVDHAYTNSLPGHTTVLTGAYPRRHGIVDNIWREIGPAGVELKSAFSVVDRRDGAPYALDAATLPEWVVAQDPRAKFAAIGSNDAPRVYAGQLRGPVFWYARDGRPYITNDNYAPAVPDWVVAFNDGRVRELAGTDWRSSIPAALAAQLRPDDSAFENGDGQRAFPYLAPADASKRLAWLTGTPAADQATLELAALATERLELGADDIPDVLAISLNSLDEIGHAYGPFSHEQTDAVLKLDVALGRFMARLDELVGAGQWVMALTADHGVNTTPEQRRLDGSDEGVRVSQETARELAEAAYAAAEGIEDPVARAAAAARRIERFPFIERAYTEQEVSAFVPDPRTREGLLALSYRPGRIPEHPLYIRDLAVAALGVYVLPKQAVMMDWGTAIHGSPYEYDRRVPLVVYGASVAPGTSAQRAATVDVAPTLAGLIGVRPRDAVDGRDLLEADPGP
ncbi:alkaline phosphatase family protein [Luteimonas vadosa]|uniref:Alkaline phosphatase family protein n=1 Tax=Luteimonas vadosa TaxID=1165507 RepID=A0ABP9DXX5_9GAMM